MNFSAIGVIAGRTVATSLMSPGPPFRLDTMGKRRQSDPRDCGATITCDESAILVKDHETWDASNLEPRTQVVLALPVAVVQGQIGKNVLLKTKASTCALSRAMNSRTDVQFRHLLNELCRKRRWKVTRNCRKRWVRNCSMSEEPSLEQEAIGREDQSA